MSDEQPGDMPGTEPVSSPSELVSALRSPALQRAWSRSRTGPRAARLPRRRIVPMVARRRDLDRRLDPPRPRRACDADRAAERAGVEGRTKGPPRSGGRSVTIRSRRPPLSLARRRAVFRYRNQAR